MDLYSILNCIDNFLYTKILIALLIFVGLYFSFRTKFVQIRLFKDAVKAVTEKSSNGKVSSFQTLMISVGSRVGTGNISGVAIAIISGGPGAVFWMWIMAIIGGASSFAESTLAQVYKIKKGDGFIGGPSYYMQKALGKRWMGLIFSFLLIFCFAYSFNALQSYTIASSLEYYIGNKYYNICHIIVGIVLVILTAWIIFGGIHRIGFISSYIVPVMSFIYIILGLAILFMNIKMVPGVLSMIMKDAFNLKSIFGGVMGNCMLEGVKKGLFASEAGMGSAPNAAASADASHPVKPGLVQVLSVFIDIILICTTTACIVLLSGVDLHCGLDGIPFVQAAVSNQFGNWAIVVITFSIFAFAFSSIVGNYCYAETNIIFIKDNKIVLTLFRITCLVAVFLGSIASLNIVWSFAQIFMGLMAVVNIIAILLLSNVVVKVLKDYMKQKKQGKDPVFKAADVGIKNTESWE